MFPPGHLLLRVRNVCSPDQNTERGPGHSAVCLRRKCSWTESGAALVSPAGVSFNSVYTQIWRVLLHLAADPFPEVSDLAMKVLNSIAYKVCCV